MPVNHFEQVLPEDVTAAFEKGSAVSYLLDGAQRVEVVKHLQLDGWLPHDFRLTGLVHHPEPADDIGNDKPSFWFF